MPHRTAWQRLPIEATCSRITSGGTPLRSNRSFYNGGSIRWVKTGELKDAYIRDTEEKITPAAIEKSSAKLFPKDTVLMAMYGDGRTITTLGILRDPAASNQACCAMIANPKLCKPLFLFYSLQAHRHALLKLAYGGAQRNLNAKTIRQFEIDVPPVPIQDRISSILSSYDDLIENNIRRIEILEEMAQRLYREWFVNFRFPGHEKVRMVESELGPIPEGWCVRGFRDVTSFISRGISPQYDDSANTWVINQKCIRDRRLNVSLARRQSKAVPAEKAVRKGDILINSTGVGTLGRVAQIHQDLANFTVDSHVTIVRPVRHPEWLGEAALHLEPDFESMGVGSTGQTELGRERIASILLICPPDSLQAMFSAHAAPLHSLVLCLLKQNENLRATRDLLLPKLISGEIPVEAAEEIASAAQPA